MKFLFSVGCAGSLLRSHSTQMKIHTDVDSGPKQAIQALIQGQDYGSIRHIVDEATKNFHKKDFDKLKLPDEINMMLGGDVELDDKSITKARQILNQMMESAQQELDEKTMRCKEFHERNRGQWSQVDTDLKRLSTQISNLEGIKQDATAEINKSTEFVNTNEEETQKEGVVYNDIRRVDEEEMVWRQNDLKVAEFLLKLTKCKGKSMLQTDTNGEVQAPVSIKRCEDKEHKQTARFALRQVQMKVWSASKIGRREIARALLSSSAEPAKKEKTLTAPKPPTEGSSQPASARKQAKKCSLGRPNCGLLHDNMSLMWGGMRDAVDALDTKMRREEKAWKKKLDNWNDQISLATGNKETSQGHLAGAIAEQTSDMAEQDKKEQEERRLEKEFRKGWAQCQQEMDEILFTKFCGVKAARGELHKKGALKPTEIGDCEVGDWVAQACSVPCDDMLKGGMQMMVREIIQQPNENGVKCPELELEKKCNEVPCPVDCIMTRWGGWSSCTADCGGGIRGQTRSVYQRAKNGGLFCDTPTEAEACNTHSCDRNCTLKKWKIRPCSVSCGGGEMVKKKHINVPARGKGKCPKKGNHLRYLKKVCNTDKCYGDEECVAKVDLLIALDGSGSVKEKGFKVLKDFAADLAKQYRGEVIEEHENEETYEPEMRTVMAGQVGVIQFGNGVIDDAGVVGPADIIQGLTNTTTDSVKVLEELKWRRGFTNMAQAFTAAETAFLNGGRQHAQSVLLVISDGKPSFNFQTENAVAKARRKGVKVVMVVVKQFLKKESTQLMKSWSSVPRKTNFIKIPGLKNLRKHMHRWVNRVLIRSCSKTVSVKKEKEAEERWEAEKNMNELAAFGDEEKAVFLAKK